MHQNGFDIASKCNIQTDAVIINQCDAEDYQEKEESFGTLAMYSTKERGLSKSRNMALEKATADICIICDDDVCYVDGYADFVKKAFDEVEDADIIVFNIEPINTRIGVREKLFDSVKRIPKYKSYGSVHIAFRRASILKAGLSFNENFGAGSGLYPMSEDSIFFAAAHRAKLKCYTYPLCFASVDFSTSTWFRGYDKEHFYNLGAFLAEAYPREKAILKWYYPLRMRGLTDLSATEIIRMINCGIKGYKHLAGYDEFLAIKQKEK